MTSCKNAIIKSNNKNDGLSLICIHCLTVKTNICIELCESFRLESVFCELVLTDILNINNKYVGQLFECVNCLNRFEKPVLTICSRKRIHALCKEKTCKLKCVHKSVQPFYRIGISFDQCSFNNKNNKICTKCYMKLPANFNLNKIQNIPIFCKNKLQKLIIFESYVTEMNQTVKIEQIVDLAKEPGKFFFLNIKLYWLQ